MNPGAAEAAAQTQQHSGTAQEAGTAAERDTAQQHSNTKGRQQKEMQAQ